MEQWIRKTAYSFAWTGDNQMSEVVARPFLVPESKTVLGLGKGLLVGAP